MHIEQRHTDFLVWRDNFIFNTTFHTGPHRTTSNCCCCVFCFVFFHYSNMRPPVRVQGISLAESRTRQEMFSLADACRITTGAQTATISSTPSLISRLIGLLSNELRGPEGGKKKCGKCMGATGWKHSHQLRNPQWAQAGIPSTLLPWRDSMS